MIIISYNKNNIIQHTKYSIFVGTIINDKKDERLIPYLNRNEHLFSMLHTQREVESNDDFK